MALCGLLATPAWAHAQLDAADAAFDEGRLAEAGRAYEDALATGRLDRSEVARAHLRLGVVSATGGEHDRAARHFGIALALEPGQEVPAELDVEARERFEAVRGERLRVVSSDTLVEVVDDPRERRPRSGVSVEVRGAPDALARTIEVRGAQDFVRRFLWDGSVAFVEVPESARPVEVRVLDPHGNVLAIDGTADAAAAFGGPPPDPLPRAGGGEVVESPWFWVVVGVIVAGVAVAVGFGASGQRFVVDAPVIR